MIDIDSLQAYVESAREHGFMSEMCGMTYLQADELFTRLRQAEKDAARYRWLREPKRELEPNGEPQSCIDVTMWTNDGEDNVNHGETICMELMDAAIDEAMQCSKVGE